MKLRIYKKQDGYYYIQKRIFHFIFIEWWIKYPYGTVVFDSPSEARKKIDEIKKQREAEKEYKRSNKDFEILRFDI